MIKNFTDAFEYVNSKDIYSQENYPIMGQLTKEQKVIFSLQCGLLRVLQSARKACEYAPIEKRDLRKFQWMAQSNEKLGQHYLGPKTATLKMVASIMFLARTVGITKEEVSRFKIPTNQEMTILIPVKEIGLPIIPIFTDAIWYLIENLAVLIEKPNAGNKVNIERMRNVIRKVFLVTMYWFDDSWVPDFLGQIPNVMESN